MDSLLREALEDSVFVEWHDIRGSDNEINQTTHSSEASTPTDAKACKERGFLDLPQPWDLAVLTYDIGQWNENGLKLEDVQRSLEYTIMEAGPSLRARAVQNGLDVNRSDFLAKLGK